MGELGCGQVAGGDGQDVLSGFDRVYSMYFYLSFVLNSLRPYVDYRCSQCKINPEQKQTQAKTTNAATASQESSITTLQ